MHLLCDACVCWIHGTKAGTYQCREKKMFDFFGFKKNARKTKVLVIDDEPKVVQTLQDRLEMNDYEVLTAYDGKEGLEKTLKFLPDLILLDIIMPVMDGLDMLEAMRRYPECSDISVIMLTARSQMDDIERSRACGIEDYIIKPFEIGELLEKMEKIVEARKTAVH
jgi:DNA-binding response OmpR family regulator